MAGQIGGQTSPSLGRTLAEEEPLRWRNPPTPKDAPKVAGWPRRFDDAVGSGFPRGHRRTDSRYQAVLFGALS